MNSDPGTIFQALVEALDREDWKAIARLCDPVSLLIFHRQLLQEYGQERQTISVDEYLRNAPEMPREVAEWEVKKVNEWMDARQRVRQEIPGIEDPTQLRAMEPIDVFEKWLAARSPRGQIEQLEAAGSVSPETAERALTKTHEAFPYTLLGVVSDGDQIAHIVFRAAFDPSEPPHPRFGFSDTGSSDEERHLARDVAGRLTPEVLTCRRQRDDTWRIIAGYHFLGFGTSVYHIVED